MNDDNSDLSSRPLGLDFEFPKLIIGNETSSETVSESSDSLVEGETSSGIVPDSSDLPVVSEPIMVVEPVNGEMSIHIANIDANLHFLVTCVLPLVGCIILVSAFFKWFYKRFFDHVL